MDPKANAIGKEWRFLDIILKTNRSFPRIGEVIREPQLVVQVSRLRYGGDSWGESLSTRLRGTFLKRAIIKGTHSLANGRGRES